MKTVGLLNPRPVLELQYKISALDTNENLILTGDEKGNVYRYQANTEDYQIITPSTTMSKPVPSKTRVDQIKFIPALRYGALVLAENLYFVNAQSGLQFDLVCKDKIRVFTINEFPNDNKIEVIAITKNKEGIILQWVGGRFEMLPNKFMVPLPPSAVAFTGSYFYLAFPEKQYSYINLEEKQLQVRQLSIPIPQQQAFLRPTDKDELFIVTPNFIGLFIGKDGMPKQKQTINLNNKPIISITTYKGYLLVLYESAIQLFNINDASKLPEIPIQSNQKYMCVSSTCKNYLYYASGSEIVFLRQTPPEDQIKELLTKARVNDAMNVFLQQIAPFDHNSQTKLDQLNLDCAWSLIRSLNFPEALKYLTKTNFDPRDLICLFPVYIITTKKLQATNDNPSRMQMSPFIQMEVQNQPLQTKDKNEQNRKVTEYASQAKDFLISALEKRRNNFTSGWASSQKDKLQLMSSYLCINQNQWVQLSVEDMLELVDYALFVAYCDQNQYESLKNLLRGNQIYCPGQYNQLKERIIKIGGELQQSIAPRFEESFKQIDSALDCWKQVSDSVDSKSQNEACSECVRILQQNPEKNRILKHLGWILKKNPTIGYKLFESIDEQLITPPMMQKLISEMDIDVNNKRNLREKYLDILISVRNVEDEYLHNELAKSLIDQIFNIYPQNTPFEQLDLNQQNQAFNASYKKFTNFISNPKARYQASLLLEYKGLKDSWMLPEIIQLYGREKRHDEALTKLIDLEQFDWAEKYCCEQNDNLLTKLFRKYIDIYNKLQGQDQKKTINNFLKKYATHPQLNPLEVLEIIPDKWYLTVERNEDGLVSFLQSVISHTLHQRRSTGAAKNLQEMDLLNVECQYANAKKSYVRITSDKKCAVCTRSIGDKVFVVYPNAVVAHHTCIKSNTICPKTEKDFEKYFKL